MGGLTHEEILASLDPRFGDKMQDMLQDMQDNYNVRPGLVSGFRGSVNPFMGQGQSQKQLRDAYLTGEAGAPTAAAPMGFSPHEYGMGIDISKQDPNYQATNALMQRLSPQYGIKNLASVNDPNHYELNDWKQVAAQPYKENSINSINKKQQKDSYPNDFDTRLDEIFKSPTKQNAQIKTQASSDIDTQLNNIFGEPQIDLNARPDLAETGFSKELSARGIVNNTGQQFTQSQFDELKKVMNGEDNASKARDIAKNIAEPNKLGAIQALGNGATLGTFNRLVAAATSIPQYLKSGNNTSYADLYDTNKQALEVNADAYSKNAPWTSTGLNAAGNISTLAATGAGNMLFGVGGKLTRMAAGGAALGGVESALSSRDYSKPLDVATDAMTGAAIGGIAAPVGKVAIDGVVGMGRGIYNFIQPNQTNRAVNALTQKGDFSIPASEIEARMLANPNLRLADTANELTQSVRGIGHQVGTDGHNKVIKSALDKTQDRLSNIGGALDEAFGKQKIDMEAAKEKMAEGISQRWNDNIGNELKEINTVDLSNAIKRGEELVTPMLNGKPNLTAPLNDGQKEIINSMSYLKDGDNIAKNAQLIHELQSDIGGLVKRKQTNQGNFLDRKSIEALKDYQKELIGAVDKTTNGAYAKARDVFANNRTAEEIFNDGADFLNTKITPDQLRSSFSKMSSDQVDLAKQAARNAIDEHINASTRAAARGESFTNPPAMKEKLEILLGNEKAKDLFRQIEDQQAITRTNNAVLNGSDTARNLAAQQAVSIRGEQNLTNGFNPLSIGVGLGSPSAVAMTVAGKLAGYGNRLFNRVGQSKDQQRNATMADILMNRGIDDPLVQRVLAGSTGNSLMSSNTASGVSSSLDNPEFKAFMSRAKNISGQVFGRAYDKASSFVQ